MQSIVRAQAWSAAVARVLLLLVGFAVPSLAVAQTVPTFSADAEVTELDVDFVALVAVSFEEPEEPGDTGNTGVPALCHPYRLAYSRSTATSADARLVGSDRRSPVDFGTFVSRPGSTTGVSSNLLVVGDDDIEGDETLHLDVYASRAVGAAAEASCSPSGEPIRSIVVVIVDDDLPAQIDSLRIDAAVDDIHREGDSGERDSVHLIVTFARRLTEPVTLRYGSVADAEARGSEPKQDGETGCGGARGGGAEAGRRDGLGPVGDR